MSLMTPEDLVPLEHFVTTEGWGRMSEWLHAMVAHHVREAWSADNAHAATKHLGAIKALQQVLQWPQMQIDSIKSSINSNT